MSSEMAKMPSVGPHWMHVRFVKNLVNASSARDLKLAATEWRLERLGVAPMQLNCHLCNTKINHHVVLVNEINDNRLVVGVDCYDKLLRFLDEGKVASALPPRSRSGDELRQYWRGRLGELPDRTVVGWLKQELQVANLPPLIADIVYTLVRLGFAPTRSDADVVVEYYKATRLFPISVLISPRDLARFSLAGQRMLPKEITINQIEKVMDSLAQEEEHRAKQREIEREVERRRRQQAGWDDHRRGINEQLVRHRLSLDQALAAGARPKAVEVVCRGLDLVSQEINRLLPVECPKSGGDTATLRQAFDLINNWWVRFGSWFFAKAELMLFVPATGEYRHLILIYRDGHWRSVKPSAIYRANTAPEPITSPALYMGRLGGANEVILQRPVADPGVIVEADFNLPSRRYRGTYIARHNGKIVLVNNPVTQPGRYRVFLMSHKGRYYRAWMI